MHTVPPLSAEARSLPPGIYQHYKGGQYRVHGIVRHSETLEELVHYEHVDDQSHWVRPLAMFLEQVQTEQGSQPRFQLTSL